MSYLPPDMAVHIDGLDPSSASRSVDCNHSVMPRLALQRLVKPHDRIELPLDCHCAGVLSSLPTGIKRDVTKQTKMATIASNPMMPTQRRG